MSNNALRIRDHLLGLVHSALRCALVKRNKEALLYVDSVDTHDGSEEQEQVVNQLHDRNVASVKI